MSSTNVNESTPITRVTQKRKENLSKQPLGDDNNYPLSGGTLRETTIKQRLPSKLNTRPEQSECISNSDNIIDDCGVVAGGDDILIENERELNEIDDSIQQEILDNRKNYRNFYKFSLNMMINYGKEFLCILALILTTCATLNNGPQQQISRAPTPRTFFPASSLVYDSPSGSLNDAQSKVSLSELALVFYYAPWCAESQNARRAYDNASRLFYREVHFGAINCWQPGGECRLQYAKVQSWPVLMAYLPNGLAVQYHGSWTQSGIVRFIRSLMSPIKRFTTPDQLLQSAVGCDAVVLAFVDLQTNRSQYQVFFQAAVKWLERDPYQEIIFGVVTGETSKLFGVTASLPTIRMYSWNETLEYNGNTSWTHQSVHRWVVEHIQQVSLWLAPPGTKSTSFSPYLKQGPVLLVFTPRNLYADTNDAYTMIRQIGMEYYNCPRDDWVHEMARDYIPHQRHENRLNHQRLVDECRTINKNRYSENLYDDTFRKCDQKSVSVTFVKVLNTSKSSYSSSSSPIDHLSDYCDVDEKIVCEVADCTGYCDRRSKKRRPRKPIESESIETSMLNTEFDLRSPDNIRRMRTRQLCDLQHLGDLEAETVFFNVGDDQQSVEFVSGMACEMNKTFSLIAIDSLLYHTFAERLGIDLLELVNKSAALIIDPDNESTYLLDEPISTRSLTNFLMDFNRRAVGRYLRTDSVQYRHTHFFSPTIEVKGENFAGERTRKALDVSIKEVYSEDFEEYVIKSNKTVVTLFHSSNCALCGLMSQNLLLLSNVLRDLPNLEFVRIDGDKNDLAWSYTMDQFPSLIVFPGDRKADSRIFPIELRSSAKHILGFILANLDRPSRLFAIIQSCKVSKRIYFLDDCLRVLRNEISENISFSLRQWRRIARSRNLIVRRLQILQELYLNLLKINHSCDVINLETNAKYLRKLF